MAEFHEGRLAAKNRFKQIAVDYASVQRADLALAIGYRRREMTRQAALILSEGKSICFRGDRFPLNEAIALIINRVLSVRVGEMARRLGAGEILRQEAHERP